MDPERGAIIGLRLRWLAATVVLVLLASTLVGWLTHRAHRQQEVPRALAGLGQQAQLATDSLAAHLEAALEVARFAAGLPDLAAWLAADLDDPTREAEVAASLTAGLEARGDLLQLRVLDRAGHERLRVQREQADGPVSRVADSALQDKSDRDYVRQGLALAPGEAALTAIEPNREHGRVQEPVRPVVRALVGLGTPGQAPAALLVLNLDLRRTLLELAPPEGLHVFSGPGHAVLLPGEGLVIDPGAPRPELPFGDLLETADTLPATRLDERAGLGLAVVSRRPAGGPSLSVALAEPTSSLLAGVRDSLVAAWRAGAWVAVAAVLLCWALTHRLARPLQSLTQAVQLHGRTGDWQPPPPTDPDLDLLAQALGRALTTADERARRLEQEVRQRRAAEQRLEQEASQLRLLSAVVQSSSDAIYSKSLDGVVTSWNPGAERLFGYPAEEIVGQPLERLVPADRRAEQAHYLARLRAGDSVRDLVTVRRHRDGRLVPVSLILSPVRDQHGNLQGLSGIARGVGDPLREQERFRVAVEASPAGMLMVDVSGRVILANQESARIFGYDQDELLDLPVERLVPDSARQDHGRHRAGFMAAPERRQMGQGRDLHGRRKDGSQVPVEVGLMPLDTDDGPCVLASVADITPRVRVEQELRRSNAELEQFAYAASHDLQEPLRMVASFTELLAQRYGDQLDDQARTYIGFAVDGARRMQRLIADLLRLSRVGAGHRDPRPVDTAALVRQLIEGDLRAAVEESGAQVELGNLPTVTGVEVQLGQVLRNLIHNAIKFHAPDRPPRVLLDARREEDAWRFDVSDNGVGIAPEDTGRIFQAFQRLHGAGEYPGNGIGLTLARKIVEQHGGRLWVGSEPDRGSTFSFTLPAERP